MNGFTIYEEYVDLITLLPNKEEQGELLLAICIYMFFDEEPSLNSAQMKIFKNLKRPLDKSKQQSKRRINQKLNENQKETEQKPNENQKETEQKPKENTSKMSMSMFMSNVNVKEDRDIRGMGEEDKEEKDTDDTSLLAEISKKIISHLNEKTGSKYRVNTKSTLKHINARLNDGYKLDDFIVVIDKKCKEWKNTEFEKHLCPDTLFGTKFEKYLNQKVIEPKQKENVPDWFDDTQLKAQKITKEDEEEIRKILEDLGG